MRASREKKLRPKSISRRSSFHSPLRLDRHPSLLAFPSPTHSSTLRRLPTFTSHPTVPSTNFNIAHLQLTLAKLTEPALQPKMTDASDLSLPSLFSPQSQYDISDITPDSPLATMRHRRRRSCDVPALLQLAPSPFHDELQVKARMQAPISPPVTAMTQPEVQQRKLSGTRDHKADGLAIAAPFDREYVRLLQKVEELSKTLANERQARHETEDAQIATQLQLQKSEKDFERIKSLLAVAEENADELQRQLDEEKHKSRGAEEARRAKCAEAAKSDGELKQLRVDHRDMQIADDKRLKSEKDAHEKTRRQRDEAKKQLADVQRECSQLKEQHKRGQGQLREAEAKSVKDSKDLQDCKTKLSRTEDALCEARKSAKIQPEVRAALVGTAVNRARVLKARKSEPCKSTQKEFPELQQDPIALRKTSKVSESRRSCEAGERPVRSTGARV
ncbi:hypothetical protein IE81DRAFT_342443 [Ceraceosorus guamensis]|uniref:Uncharacterized protein n=1 Tax=Ceraceosorus guamensis TaxID=1522189 RepID=A0A316VU05_9BASI|nr:hypothetical protein IE81DRAFT_342443 [Ceraceosorus guamensis]PWN40890.1 hypothetical protein IE81DRAFT_342443 [Ceraceosorus guamensis]